MINGIGFKFEVDNADALKKTEEVRERFEQAFGGGRVYQRSRAEISQMIADLDRYVKTLEAAYNERAKLLDEKGLFSRDDEELKNFTENIKESKRQISELKTALRDLKSSPADLSAAFESGRNREGSNAQIKKQISDVSTYLRQLKKQYEETKEVIEGKGGDASRSPLLKNLEKDIKTAESELQGLRENMRERNLSSENMFIGVAQGARGLMGAFTAAQGAAAMFGAEEEKLQKIQTKLQASMSILMGLQQLGNTLQSTSQFRIQVVNKLMEKWHALNLKVAKSEGIKKAAMLGVAGAVAIAITALTALLVHLSRTVEKTKEARELQKAWREEFKNSATQQMVTFKKLQAGWDSLNGDLSKQQQYIAQNKGEFESLGKSVTSVKDAEAFLIKDKDAFVESMKQKARAAADLAKLNLLVAKSIEFEGQIEEAEAKKPGKFGYFLYRFGAMQSGQSYKTYEEYAKDAVEANVNGLKEKQKEYDDQIDELVKKMGQYDTTTNEVDRKKFQDSLNARVEAAKKGYESILRLNEDMANKLAEENNATIANDAQREIEALRLSHEKKLQELEREKKDYIEKLKEQAKLEFLAANPNAESADFGTNWKPTAEQQATIDAYYDDRADIENKAYARAQRKLFEKLEKTKLDYWKQYGTLAAKEKAIIEDYGYQIADAVDRGDIWEQLRLYNERDEALWKTRNDTRLQYMEEYGTIEQKEFAINTRYVHDMLNLTDEYSQKLRARQRDMDLFNLQKQKGGKYYNIFRDTDRMNIVQITDAIKLAEDAIKDLSKDAEGNADKIQAMKSALENLKAAANDFSLSGVLRSLFSSDKDDPTQTASFRERIEGIRKAWADMSADRKAQAVGGWASSIAQHLGQAAQYMRDLASASGDTKFSDAADRLEAFSQNLAAAGQGAQAGGGWGALAGGLLNILQQTQQASLEVELAEVRAKKAADDWARALRNVSVEMDEAAYASPFGEKSVSKGREGARAALETMRRYHEEVAAINEEYNKKYYKQRRDAEHAEGSDSFGGMLSTLRGWDVFFPVLGTIGYEAAIGNKVSSAFAAYEEAISKGYDGLQRMLINKTKKGGWAKFWGAEDEYVALGDLYPQLFKDGELVIDQAKLLLETNNELDDSQKEQIRNIVELKEKYDEALKAIDDAISDNFGSIAASITDVIWDSVMNGTDAWGEFQKVGSEAIAKLGKQLIQEMLITTYLDQFRERMRDAYMMGNATDTQNELRRITAEIFGGLSGVYEGLADVARDWKEYAEQEGFDLTEATQRNAASKAINGVSQETFNEMSGRVTSIQLSAYNIDETTQAIREQQTMMATQVAQILLVLNGIHGDTGGIREAVAGLRDDMTLVKSTLGTIADKGVRMLN